MHPLLDNYFKFIKRFIPGKQEESCVGLDIGISDCKLIELVRSGNSFEIINFGIEPIVKGDIPAAIQKLLDNLKRPCYAPCTAIFGKGTLIRYIELPRMPVDDLRKSFSIEADKYFPFAQDQIYTDCYVLDPQGNDKNMSVMAVASKKDLVDQRIKLLKDLDIEVEHIGINPVALANVINVLGFGDDSSDDSAVAILDLGESVSSLTILLDKAPRFSRDIFIGGRDFTKSISNSLSINSQEAEQLKRAPSDKSKEVAEAGESTMMNIVQELKLSFDYFSTEKSIEISHLLLTGGASRFQGIAEFFEKNLEIKVRRWNPLSTLKISSDVSKEELERNFSKLGVALGLALYSTDD